VARVIRFDPTQRPDMRWERFPRFDEIGAQIDAQASRLFDNERSLEAKRELYAKVEARLNPDDRALLRELYQAICSHQEHYEHAAYLVGLRAASGQLEGLPPVLSDDRSDEDPQPA
jgi:hypothetical protein